YITYYNTRTLAETINILCRWLSDDDIFCAIYEEYQQAWDFAKVLSIVNQNNEFFDLLNISNEQSSQLNNENDFSDFFINNSSQSNEVSDSHTIAIVANIVADFNMLNLRDDDIENDSRDARFELAFLLSDTNSLDDQNFLDNQNLETHENFYTGVTKQKFWIHTNSIRPNMVSSLIANYTSNIEISQSEKLREGRWKNRSHLSILSNMNKKV
ncbi:26409_t:CDS:2, partial [Gigaspora margarita]